MQKNTQNSLKIFFQYFFSPILVVLMGFILNHSLEVKKTEIEQFNLAQNMIKEVFTEDVYQAFATQRLLEKVLDDTLLRNEVSDIVLSYYENKIDEYIENGQIQKAQSIVNAAKYIGGRLGNRFILSISKNEGKKHKLDKYKKALKYEREGYINLLSSRYDKAIKSFENSERIYPTFHQVYEISRLLKKNRNKLPQQKKRIFNEILDNYSWGAPSDLLEEMRKQIGRN